MLAIDSPKTLTHLWELAAGREDVKKTLRLCFGYDHADRNKPQIRTSDEKLDYVLVDFLCAKGLHGYAGDYIATAGGGQFHPECVMCGDPIHVEINEEYKVLDKPGLASPVEKHIKIQGMLERKMDINPKKRKENRNSTILDYDSGDENNDPNKKSRVVQNLGFSDEDELGGGARRKKRTQKKRIRRHKTTQIRHKQKKNKSRK